MATIVEFEPDDGVEPGEIVFTLRQAAKRIESDGWCRDEYALVTGECDAEGGIFDIRRHETDDRSWTTRGTDGNVAEATLEAFRRYLGYGRDDVDSVWQWNDQEGRTAEEVVAALNGCADAVEDGWL